MGGLLVQDPSHIQQATTQAQHTQIPITQSYGKQDLSQEAIAHRDYIFNNAVGSSPKLVCMVDGVQVKALADTGSEVTTITKSLYLQHFQSKIEDTTYWLHVGAANYQGVPYLGYTELDVEVDGQMIKKAGILIQEDPTDPIKQKEKKEVPMTLGCNIINRLVYEKLHEPLKAYVQTTYPQYTANTNKIDVTLNPNKPEKLSCFAKTNRKTATLIPALTEMTIMATTVNTRYPFQALVEGTNRQLSSGLIVFPTFQKVEHGQVRIHVGNMSDKDLYIPRNQKIAIVTQGEEVIPEYEMAVDEETGKKIVYLQEQHTESEDDTIPDIDLGDLSEFTPEQKERLMKLIRDNKAVFSKNDDDIGCTNVMEHEIITTDDIPIRQPDRRVLPQLQPEVRKHLQNWLQQGIIRESTSPYGQQMVIVKKKSGDLRICIDFRQLNQKTILDAFPLPNVEQVLEALKDAKWFSVMDLISGYLQLPLAENSKFKTAFRALGQLFEFERMPFGVKNGPATFSRLMSKCFGDLHLIWLIIFLDDLLVYSKTIDEMLDRL